MYKYSHGGDIYSEKANEDGKNAIDFSANINPLGMPAGVRKALRGSIQDCLNYPDTFCRRLVEKIALHHSVSQESIFVGNGAADVLFRLALALKPKRALLLAPTFSDYEKALLTVDCNIEFYNLSEENDFCIQDDYLERITAGLDFIVICNPNNPTGQVTSRAMLLKIIEKCHTVGTKILIDECFMDFVDEEKDFSVVEYLSAYDNLIVLGAFTKIYAMPGVRLGYCLTNKASIIDACRESGQDWNVSTLAQAAGIAALQDRQYLEKTKEYIRTERAYLIENLTKLNAKIYGSKANYIFFSLVQVANLPEKLRKEGFLIRECANYRNLGDNYFRIAVRKKTENKLLIKALRKILKNENTVSSY